MDIIGTVLGSPALLVGLARAIVILLISFGVQITEGQSAAIYGLLGAVLAVVSLVFSAVTHKKTVPSPQPPAADPTTPTPGIQG